MTKERAGELAKEYGFTNHGFFDAAKLIFMPEVRNMCEANLCGKYGRTWSCPPAIDSLEEITARAKEYDWGLLVQTTAFMEDPFDGDTMMEARGNQEKNFLRLVDLLRGEGVDALPMGSGGCTYCETCSYPGEPCRFPEKMISSMEAYGLMVKDVCVLADTPYYYGKNTVTFTSCVLFKNE